MASTAPSTHPMSACGPPICDMLTVVAGKRPRALTKPSSLPCAVVFSASDLPEVAIRFLLPKNVPCANSSSQHLYARYTRPDLAAPAVAPSPSVGQRPPLYQ